MKTVPNARRRPQLVIAALIASMMVLLGVFAVSSQGAKPPAPTPAPTGSADLAITNVDSADPVSTGAVIVYTITVTNNGPDAAVSTVVTDRLEKGVGFLSATNSNGTCSIKGLTVTCAIDKPQTPLAAYGTPTITLSVRAPGTAGVVRNTATVSSSTKDPSNTNNSATQTTQVNGPHKPPTVMCLGSKAGIIGTSAGETLRGTPHKDVIFAAGGSDLVYGLGGDDLICGAGGNDRIRSGGGRDRVSGGGGRDRILGNSGNDILRGGNLGDVLRGGGGDDLLAGNAGNDRCFGGPGVDRLRSC